MNVIDAKEMRVLLAEVLGGCQWEVAKGKVRRGGGWAGEERRGNCILLEIVLRGSSCHSAE